MRSAVPADARFWPRLDSLDFAAGRMWPPIWPHQAIDAKLCIVDLVAKVTTLEWHEQGSWRWRAHQAAGTCKLRVPTHHNPSPQRGARRQVLWHL
jgi:hypothetical protein